MTAQEIYTKVRKHLLTQMAVSKVSRGSHCLYRSPEGLSCAVGCLLDDDLAARLDQVSKNGFGDVESIQELLPENLRAHVKLLETLQVVHDKWPPESWEERLNAVARTWGLEPV